MEKFTYLIIGGGAAGTVAAETIRQNDSIGSVAIVNDELHPLYSRVMLSKPSFFLKELPVEKILLRDMEWYQKKNISFINGSGAVKLDTVKKVVTLANDKQICYEKLLLAIGTCARQWNVPGSDKKGVFSLRTIEDGYAIAHAMKTAKHGVTVGGGFISFEIADILRLGGLNVTNIIRESHYWEPTLDNESSKMIEKALLSGGVNIVRNAEINKITGGDTVNGVTLKDGTVISCNMVVVGIGVVCPFGWLKSCGINTNNGILTNEYLETSISDVWAAGDSAEFNDLILEETVQLGNWVNAHEQGRIAGLNMAGKKTPFKFVSFYTTQGFNTNIAFVGDARPLGDRIIIKRGGSEINSYARILIVGKELIGATLINRTNEMRVIAKIIEQNVDVSGKYKELADTNFDLRELV